MKHHHQKTEQLCKSLSDKQVGVHYACLKGGVCYVNGNGMNDVCGDYVARGNNGADKHDTVESCACT